MSLLIKTLENQIDTPDLMERRKNDHITICAQENVESPSNGFERYAFVPNALPEIDCNEINTQSQFLGHTFSYPIFITGMTGGVDKGQHINEILATIAQKFNIPMGLGSQKMVLSEPKFKPLFNVRKIAPKAFIIGNIGAVSLNYGVKIDDIQRLCDEFQLNAFALHLNALQESIQPEGERNFSNLLLKIEKLTRTLNVPVVIKEVGCGVSRQTFSRLIETGIKALDVGGRGGTSWGYIEGLRGAELQKRLGTLFKDWGLSTCESLVECARAKDEMKVNVELSATGGLRNGLDVAKAIALGARMGGVGLPLFKKAASALSFDEGVRAVEQELVYFIEALKIAMFCTGSKDICALKSSIKDLRL